MCVLAKGSAELSYTTWMLGQCTCRTGQHWSSASQTYCFKTSSPFPRLSMLGSASRSSANIDICTESHTKSCLCSVPYHSAFSPLKGAKSYYYYFNNSILSLESTKQISAKSARSKLLNLRIYRS